MKNTNKKAVEIILVEDNIFEADLTIRALKKCNMSNNLVHLKDGEEALDFIFCRGKFVDRVDVTPKLILLDLKMPRVDGIQVLREIKSNERSKMIPVVILTSSKEDPDIEKCYKLGANSYIVKPVGFDNFSKTIINLGFYWMVMNVINAA